MSTQLDLSKLALERSPSPQDGPLARRRSAWFSRYAVPAVIIVGFMILLAVAARDQFLPRPNVTVVPVIVKQGEVQTAGTPLFQAAGWIEPRPTPVSVAALTPGVIEELLVVEGQRVEQGEPIARLIRIDAELAVEQAEATLAIRKGELLRAQAEHEAAQVRFEKPVHLKAQLADAQSLLAKAKTELNKLPFLIRSANANVEFTERSLSGKREAGNAVAEVVVNQAAKEHANALAELEELQQRGPLLQREIDALQDKVNALQEQLELLTEERRQLAESKAKVASAEALRDEAQSRLRQAKLELDRTVVRAPIQGTILRLVASPGMRLMGQSQTAGQSSSTVVEMYDPDRLQVRADVRLEDVPLVTPGAPVNIETASSKKAIKGRVLLPTSKANIQKNTLEVKVELVDPPTTVSPEMLVTATFLAPELETDAEPVQAEFLLVPKQLVKADEDGEFIWIVNADGQAMRRQVQVGMDAANELVEITEGLNATDKLIASGTENLSPGVMVKITGQDQVIGMGR